MTMEEMMETNGWRIDTVGGERRLVTVDENGRAVVGPKPRRHEKRGLLARFRRNRERVVTRDSNEETVVIDTDGVRSVRGIRAAFLDIDVHKAIQHAALDVALWAIGVSLAAVALKTAYWVVVL
jgi:NMD protein affecting ribosome stability and mRNA decay